MSKLVSWLCKIFFAPVVKGFFIKEIRGLENIPKTNFILASNHLSYFDVLADGYLLVPRRFSFIGQVDKYNGIAKLFIRLAYFIFGVIPLDRNSQKSRAEVIGKAIKALNEGKILVIYPEGTRSLDGKIQEGKKGLAKVFLKTGRPILPVALLGTVEAGRRLKKMVRINIGKPLYFEAEFEKAKNFEEYSKEYEEILKEITDKVMSKIKELALLGYSK